MRPTASDCRFCAACARQITDFTAKTDAEILDYLKQQNGKICGRFRADQLGRALASPYRPGRFKGLGLAAGLASWFAVQPPAQGQAALPPVPAEHTAETPNPSCPKTESGDTLRTLSGRIIDSVNGDPLIGASVCIAGTRTGAVCDLDGMFSLRAPVELFESDSTRLLITYTGYHAREITIPNRRLRQEDLSLLTIRMTFDKRQHYLEGLIGVVVYKPTLRQRVGRFFHRLFH